MMVQGRMERSIRAACAALVGVLAVGCAGGKKPETAPAPATATSTSARGATAEERARTATAEDWQGQSNARVEELFAGRFPGVRVQSAQGGIIVRIRGASSINGDGAPLYVVDGLPIDAPNGLLSISPSDVAKIEVLKDISQTAYYGVRGANGVVLISTKRAKK